MNEVKKPKKSIISYYLIVLLVMMLFNWLVMPWILQRQIQQVDYGTFMTMTEEGNIGQVDIQSNQIVFTGGHQNLQNRPDGRSWTDRAAPQGRGGILQRDH